MSKLGKRQDYPLFIAFNALFALGLVSNPAKAQDMDIQGDGSNGQIILQGRNINPTNSDIIGVHGYSNPAPYFGIGVLGSGGYIGLKGIASGSGNGTRMGMYSMASGGATNYGAYSEATGTGTNYGLYGSASGTGSIGVYGSSTGSAAGFFSGNLKYTGTLSKVSDRKFKKNVSPLRNCLSIVGRLAPKEFDYRTEEFPVMNLPSNRQLGLIAQEVEGVLPQLVDETPMPVDPKIEAGQKPRPSESPTAPAEMYKGVDYIDLIPVLIGAIQEQQGIIAELQAQVNKLKK